jgi:putative nucleotidyltransferase with HDIG domain
MVVSTSVLLLLAGAVVAAYTWDGAAGRPLFFVLLGIAVVARATLTHISSDRGVSGVFVCSVLAIGFLDPFCAFTIPIVAELFSWAVLQRYRWRALLINLPGIATPDALAAWGFSALALRHHAAAFPLALAGAGVCVMVANVLIVDPQFELLDEGRLRLRIGLPADYIAVSAFNVALAAALAEVYAQTELAVIVFALLIVLAFMYMTRLVALARTRTREYANLSWGVLSSLVRTLDQRDHRAARHCAAVARFSRDIAARSGMSEREQELAHTAGLLHDIGRFALSDRVLEPEGDLTQEDWRVVRLHPSIGADLLQDLGVYGPVAEIVLAHHERLDGRGYPNGIVGDQIPVIARIVAVAEVYDTLTAPDTYRQRMTSFEALTELRRVAGAQLDSAYVEILAALLAGQGTDYRHADEADYDRELDIERRLNEAAAT